MAVNASRAQLEGLIGADATERLLAKYGGQSLYFPRRETAGQAIMQVVGAVAFEILRFEFGTLNVNLPGKPRPPAVKEQIAQLLEVGLSINEIAERAGCSGRYVSMIKADLGLSKATPRRKPAPKPRTGADGKA
jgi:hypothetical protein